MKKSEYLAGRNLHWITVPFMQAQPAKRMGRVLDDVAAAEAAGVTWDSEEPMAERLYVTGHHTPLAAVPGGREASDVELGIAADFYNRREDIQNVANELRAFVANSVSGRGYWWPDLEAWANTLEGRH